MEPSNLEKIKAVCKKYGIKPRKELGQNFLISRGVLEKVLVAAKLAEEDKILEIGPGLGVLTEELARAAGRVVAVETDSRLARVLRDKMKDYSNVEIVENDILKFQVSSFKFREYKYKIVANLPYQITSAVLRKFLESEPRPSMMVVMVQKEVAERICAGPGKMSLLSLSVQFFGRPEIVAAVGRENFWPEPEVDSAIVKIAEIEKTTKANLEKIKPEEFFRIARIGFSARRKQLKNNLASGLRLPSWVVEEILTNMVLDSKVRAQDLSLRNWLELARRLK